VRSELQDFPALSERRGRGRLTGTNPVWGRFLAKNGVRLNVVADFDD
jgi:hypothetical protein